MNLSRADRELLLKRSSIRFILNRMVHSSKTSKPLPLFTRQQRKIGRWSIGCCQWWDRDSIEALERRKDRLKDC